MGTSYSRVPLVAWTGDAQTTPRQSGPWLHLDNSAGTALTNDTSETVLASTTIPANVWEDDCVFEYYAVIRATATNSTDTLQIIVRFGTTTLTGTAVVTSVALDVANNDVFVVSGLLSPRDADSSGTIVATGTIMPPNQANVIGDGAVVGSTDFTADQLLEVTGTWSVSSTGNSCQSEFFAIKRTN